MDRVQFVEGALKYMVGLTLALLALATVGCGTQSMALQSCKMGAVEAGQARYYVLPTQIADSAAGADFQEVSREEVAQRVTDGVLQGLNGQAVTSPSDVPAANRANAVLVSPTVTRYDEGSATARLMLAGLGQMDLYLELLFRTATDNAVVNRGVLEKNYSGGGIIGASATMRENVLGLVGQGVAEGISGCQESSSGAAE